jgi:hypothetical protein
VFLGTMLFGFLILFYRHVNHYEMYFCAHKLVSRSKVMVTLGGNRNKFVFYKQSVLIFCANNHNREAMFLAQT